MLCSEGYDLDGKIEHETSDGSRDIVFPGPMRGLLPLLEGQCLSLTFLFLRKAGQICGCRPKNFPPAPADEEVYSAWVAFIEYVKLTLKVLIIEQGTNTMIQRPMCLKGGIRRIDARFRRIVIPCLESSGWSSLQRMELRGTGIETRSRGTRMWKRFRKP